MTIERIIEVIKKNNPDADVDLVMLAYEFAKEAHGDRQRKSGELYIQHPLETSYKLAQMNIDLPTVVAGILHDVPEDTSKTLEDVEKNFGKEIARLVEGITKLGTIKYRGLERYAENLRKMFVAMAEDVRVIFIKFADRIHNLKTLYALPPVKQQRIAQESLEIYAPIANRLGMDELKSVVEDLAFPYVYPEEYKWVLKISKKKFEEQKRYIQKVIKIIDKELKEKDTVSVIKIEGRPKHYYSLYQKLLRKEMDIDRIYDVVALRVIVKNIDDCYRVLGYVHALWKPLKGRIKDYISQPKPNGYQSLHTTVFGYEGRITEFQIRTQKMHEEAEYGIAAHWAYKNNDSKDKKGLSKAKLKWIKELLDEQEKVRTPRRYLKTLKLDFFKNRIFVFTPKGDVIDLPENAVPIDFAYCIHTDVGHKCVGVKINEKMANLKALLKNGDMIEILVDKNRKGPSEGWLPIVKTHLAKNKIKSFFKKERKLNIFKFFNR
ncbi:RelA/SpoT family protein [Patescibacteria group bacterium]|nr:RelA/SpoT family protein [Patescibacteria group bacterium]